MISGSLRTGSTNDAVVRTAEVLAPPSVKASRYTGTAELPHFNPDDDHDPLHPAVVELRSRIEAADAVLFCTPEYAGALPGSFKNLLDWTVGGVEIGSKPAIWINASNAGPHGAARAHDSLRAVLGFTGADLIETLCAHIPIPRDVVGQGGIIQDESLRDEVVSVLQALVAHLDQRAG